MCHPPDIWLLAVEGVARMPGFLLMNAHGASLHLPAHANRRACCMRVVEVASSPFALSKGQQQLDQIVLKPLLTSSSLAIRVASKTTFLSILHLHCSHYPKAKTFIALHLTSLDIPSSAAQPAHTRHWCWCSHQGAGRPRLLDARIASPSQASFSRFAVAREVISRTRTRWIPSRRTFETQQPAPSNQHQPK